ncbi:MAG: hypothetical protein JZU49_02815 [Sulfuricurvum sp.]|nr:hypothetical protein [Sulfuricurvum sp.]
MAKKRVMVTANTEIEYENEKHNKQSKPFEMDEETANALSAKGIIKKVADTTAKLKITTTETKE